ncbi:hypothetical protein AJ87_27000 [Rhizobium yanglingense]|nr:hypothetical protein AJ87_27000 [Rhizobium yanglingense]
MIIQQFTREFGYDHFNRKMFFEERTAQQAFFYVIIHQLHLDLRAYALRYCVLKLYFQRANSWLFLAQANRYFRLW